MPIRGLIKVFLTQTDIGRLVLLDTEQLISHTKAAVVDTIAPIQGSDGGVIAASGVHKLLTGILDILESAVSIWVGNKVIF